MQIDADEVKNVFRETREFVDVVEQHLLDEVIYDPAGGEGTEADILRIINNQEDDETVVMMITLLTDVQNQARMDVMLEAQPPATVYRKVLLNFRAQLLALLDIVPGLKAMVQQEAEESPSPPKKKAVQIHKSSFRRVGGKSGSNLQ